MQFCGVCGNKFINICAKCGTRVSIELEFCTKCGFALIQICPRCGVEIASTKQFCDSCGQDLNQAVEQETPVVYRGKRHFPVRNIVAASIGIIMIAGSLLLPWFAVRLGDSSTNWSAIKLMTTTQGEWPMWVGTLLPLIILLLLTAIVIFSIIYSFIQQSAARGLWAVLGFLLVLCITCISIYFLWWVNDRYTEPGNIVHVGSILAFVGALTVMLSSAVKKPKRKYRIN
jgi:ribosomal protein L40E